MKQGPRYRVKPRRRRKGYTDYRIRLGLIKSRKPRIVVRKSLKNTNVQFVEYQESGDKIIVSATSQELVKAYNWKYSTSSTPAAYLTGLLAGKKAIEKGIEEGVLDIGRYVPVTGSKVFAVLRGILDAGVDCPHSEKKLPAEERILGEHLKKEISTSVNEIKGKIIGGK